MSANNDQDHNDEQVKLSDDAAKQIDGQYGTPGNKQQAGSGLHTNFAHAAPESACASPSASTAAPIVIFFIVCLFGFICRRTARNGQCSGR